MGPLYREMGRKSFLAKDFKKPAVNKMLGVSALSPQWETHYTDIVPSHVVFQVLHLQTVRLCQLFSCLGVMQQCQHFIFKVADETLGGCSALSDFFEILPDQSNIF